MHSDLVSLRRAFKIIIICVSNHKQHVYMISLFVISEGFVGSLLFYVMEIPIILISNY